MLEEQRFAEILIRWQQRAGRHDLPWQQARTPYRVWLSEIMLQQTQVSTVIPYFERFIERFPDVEALAAASADEVLAHWAGLGYYARARNLHRCAQQIVTVHGGAFPKTAATLAELPGIGRSTAAAIAAFCFGEKSAILDGNVKRVLCRVFGISGFPGSTVVERKLWSLAEALLPETGIGTYTQGLMDLGATVCTRGKPDCDHCPFTAACVARREGRQRSLPEARPKRIIPERRASFVLIVDAHQRLLLQRRPPSGIWGGLLVPPEGEANALLEQLQLRAPLRQKLPHLLHTFTHFRLELQPTLCRIDETPEIPPGEFVWIALEHASDAGVPTPIRKLIRRVASVLG
ncbi:MAG: A/G-specific adenine glycosylase [Azonexus sp.]|nr:A/G-specific adenine glycosylase [Azonexus sp.]